MISSNLTYVRSNKNFISNSTSIKKKHLSEINTKLEREKSFKYISKKENFIFLFY